jgi:glycosyltransferase involved in cell wall biosynthesis
MYEHDEFSVSTPAISLADSWSSSVGKSSFLPGSTGKTLNLNGLRIAFVAGGLGLGGSEKQLTYMARILVDAGADVRIYSLTRNEHYETELLKKSSQTYWIGRSPNPVYRTFVLLHYLRSFRPHIVQSTHFFTNLYTVIVARMINAIELGALRSSTSYALQKMGSFGPFLLRWTKHLIVNSYVSRQEAIHLGIHESQVSYLSNVIDLNEFDQHMKGGKKPSESEHVIAIQVANCFPVKRTDRFLAALALAKEKYPKLIGWVIGEGPERTALEVKAIELGLKNNQDIYFLGQCLDIPALLNQGDILCLTSESEGFPNVLIEGMAAKLPVIAYDVGDVRNIVLNDKNGFIVERGVSQMAALLVELARDADKRALFGKAGREIVERSYSYNNLLSQLFEVYVRAANQQRKYPEIFKVLGSNGDTGKILHQERVKTVF